MAQFTNQAQLAYNNSVTNSNIAVGEVLEVLSATKTAVRSEYGQNDTVTYTISIVNAGAAALSGISVSDNLGAYNTGNVSVTPLTYLAGTIRYYSNGVLQRAPSVTAGPPLAISGITVPANGNVILIYEAQVNQYAPLGADGQIVNQAQISGTGVTPVTVTATVTAESEPILSITKSVSPVPVTENGTLTYTFLIQNTGSAAADAAVAAVITDTFNPILTGLSVTFNGVSWSEGVNYNYNELTGLFSTAPGQVTVDAAAFAQDAATGVWTVNPGVSTLVVSGTV